MANKQNNYKDTVFRMVFGDLFYVSKILQGLTVNEDLYSSRRIHISVPRFYMFYNGLREMPEQ